MFNWRRFKRPESSENRLPTFARLMRVRAEFAS
jgi:hypothetical protein